MLTFAKPRPNIEPNYRMPDGSPRAVGTEAATGVFPLWEAESEQPLPELSDLPLDRASLENRLAICLQAAGTARCGHFDLEPGPIAIGCAPSRQSPQTHAVVRLTTIVQCNECDWYEEFCVHEYHFPERLIEAGLAVMGTWGT